MALTLFAGSGSGFDTELWSTDGTTGRTSLVKDIRAGVDSSGPSNSRVSGGSLPFAVLGNYAYFSASSDGNAAELWRSDGTTAGTTLFASDTGAAGYSPTNIVSANGLIFFLGTTVADGYGIYKTNGVLPPSLVTTVGGGLTYMAAAGNNVYWAIDDGLSSSGLYTSDGTVPGTTKPSGAANGVGIFSVGDVAYYATTAGLSKLTGGTLAAVTGAPAAVTSMTLVDNGTVFFTAQAGSTLYSTTLAGTVATVVKGGLDLFTLPPSVTAVGNNVVFVSTTGGHGSELWVSDGTTLGTVEIKDLVAGLGSGNPKNLTKVGSEVFFQASDGNNGLDLWKTDGTLAGTVLVKHLASLSMGASGAQVPGDITAMWDQGGVLLFTYDDGLHGPELWRSDGTAAGTMEVLDINTGLSSNSTYQGPNQFTVATIGSSDFFTGQNLAGGYELWTSNGTPGGTGLLKDINPGVFNSMPQLLTAAGSKVFFTATEPVAGTELWVSDGTLAGTHLVKDINPGAAGSGIFSLGAAGTQVYFAADNGTTGSELWVSNGTLAGTLTLGDLNPGAAGSNPFGFTAVGTDVFFSASTAAAGNELWATDGTAGAGTHLVKDINPGAGSANIGTMTPFTGMVFFTADDGTSGTELWSSNGLLAGTTMVKDINTGGGSSPNSLIVVNGTLFFTAYNGTTSDLWASSDGTSSNTLQITSGLTNLSQPVGAGSNLFFSAFGASGQEIYVTDGPTLPALIDIVAGGSSSNPNYLTPLGNKIVFQAQGTIAAGYELWVSDGTALGTVQVMNINPTINTGSNPQSFVVAGTKAFFVADDGTNGSELWVTDGTLAGTHLVKNIGPTTMGGSVQPLKAVGDSLLFMANDQVNGSELWMTDGTLAGTFRVTDVVQPSGSTPGSFTQVPLTAPGANAEVLTGTADADYFDGLAGNDTISGLGGNDILLGGADNDTLDGGAGTDLLTGGTGNDTYVVNSVLDVVTEGLIAGTDLLQSTAVAYTLPGNVENLTLLGAGNINGTGNSGNNVLTGNGGNNVLNGGIGADAMAGGAGNDTYMVNSVLDVVTEALDAGTDLVQSSAVTHTLSANVENLTLLGAGNINGTGNALANVLTGNGGNNVLNGGTGADNMAGGLGNDTYVVNSVLDVVTEALNAGTDLVQSSAVTHTLSANVENLTLLGAGNINGTGNALANVLTGNSGNNVLNGGDGNDTLIWSSADNYDGGTDADTLRPTGGNLNLTAITNTKILNVETINLTGVGDNVLTLDKQDLLDISSTTNTLKVLGDAGDSIHIVGAFTDTLVVAGGFHKYTIGGTVATLLVDTDITSVT